MATPVNFKPDAAKDFYRSKVRDKGYLRDMYFFPSEVPEEESPDIDTRTVTLPFILGEAIMLGHSLAVAANEGLIPFCDENIHFGALAAKMKTAIDLPGVRKLLEDYTCQW